MRVIYKYPLEIKNEQFLSVPILRKDLFSVYNINEQILKMDIEKEKPYLYIMVDTEENVRNVIITMYETGKECYESKTDYIDSFKISPHGINTITYHVFVKEE